MYDVIVVGIGFSGAVLGERLASIGKRVLIIDRRSHIAGNMYDYIDENGIIIHKYGPHLFHTRSERVYRYLSEFTDFFKYEHRVLGKVSNQLVPIPFNFESIRRLFSKEKANQLIEKLKENYGDGVKVPILSLKNNQDKDLRELSEFVYENVFLHYTVKQWGVKPEDIDPSVTARVPVNVSDDDRYFNDEFQFMPKLGYTKLFEKMLANKNITIELNVDFKDVCYIENDVVFYRGKKFDGTIIYSGQIDELFNYQYGALPYRTLKFETMTINKIEYQPAATVNYPTKEDAFTRITEYKHMTTVNNESNKTVITKEFPMEYKNGMGNDPYYPIASDNNFSNYNKYLNKAKKIDNFYLIGRLASYKYYNMDQIILEALELYEKIKDN